MSCVDHSVYSGRFGYYYCSYGDFLIIKEFHWLAYLDMRATRTYERWLARLPHNRTGNEPVKPFGTSIKDYLMVLTAYRSVRMPASSPESVVPFQLHDRMDFAVPKIREMYGENMIGRLVSPR
jgi:hypothetical protein